MACLRKIKSKVGFTYHIDFSYQGKRYVKSTKTSDLSIAKQILKDIEGKIARGNFDIESLENKSILLSEFFKQYFEYAKSYKAPATIINERIYSEKFLKFIGNVSMHTISVKNLDLWKAGTLEKVSPTTFNIERRTLQAMFSVALRWEFIKSNPFIKVQKAKVEEKRLFLEQAEFNNIITLIDGDIAKTVSKRDRRFLNQFKEFILFSVNTGMRRSEVLQLSKADVDMDRGVIHVIKTKSKQTRVIPLNRISRSIVESLGDEMFHRLNANHISRKFNSYLKTANLSQFKLHSLRHTFATNLIHLGVDVYTVSRLLGHSDIRTTLIYAKMKVEVMKEAVNRLTPDPVALPTEKISS